MNPNNYRIARLEGKYEVILTGSGELLVDGDSYKPKEGLIGRPGYGMLSAGEYVVEWILKEGRTEDEISAALHYLAKGEQ